MIVSSADKNISIDVSAIDALFVYVGNGANITAMAANGTSGNTGVGGIFSSIKCDDTVTATGSTAGQYAFSSCGALEYVTIPNGSVNILAMAFQSCVSLINVDIPDNIVGIGASCFYNCGKLQNVNIPKTVLNIGANAFQACRSITSVDIPPGVETINNYAFYQSGLTSINIPNSVTTIGGSAFGGCNNLKVINIPKSITSIGSAAFSGLTALININIEPGWVAPAMPGGTSGFNFSLSPKFAMSSMIDFLNNIGATSVVTVIPFGATNIARLQSTQEGVAALATAAAHGYTIN
jgi:hypothetical protein